MKRFSYIVLFTIIAATAHAGQGFWQTHLNGNNLFDIDIADGEVFAATDGGLVVWDRVSGEHRQLTRADGLLSNQLSIVAIDKDGTPWISFEDIQHRSSLEKIGDDGNIIFDPSNSGLGEYKIRKVFFDSKGTMWIGTISGGVFEFDGITWKNHKTNSILNKPTLDVFVAPDGVLWLANGDGIWSFDGYFWRNLTLESGLGDIVVNDIAMDDDGVFWLATNKGLLSYDGYQWRMFTKSDGLVHSSVKTVAIESDGTVWVGTNFGVSSFDGVNWKSYTAERDLVSDQISSITVDSTDNVWIVHSATTEGLSKFNGREWEWYTIWNRQEEQFPSNYVFAMTAGPDGTIYAATDKGIFIKEDSIWEQLFTEKELKTPIISQLFLDAGGVLWIIYDKLEHTGFSSYDGKALTHFLDISGIDAVTSFYRDDNGVLYLGNNQGVSIGDGSTWTHYPDNNSLESADIFGLAEDRNGIMWFATGQGISRYDGLSWITYSSGDYLMDDLIEVFASPTGDIWALSSFGVVVKLDGDTAISLPLDGDFVREGMKPRVREMAVTNEGSIWADFNSDSEYDTLNEIWVRPLWKFNGVSWTRHQIESPLPVYDITEMIPEGEDELWIASDAGLFKYDGAGTVCYRTDGPISNNVRHIAVDVNNTAFMSTDRGLTYNDGISWGHIPDFSTGEIVFDHDNVLWMSYDDGVAYYADGEITVIPSDKIGEDYFRTISVTVDESNTKWLGTNWGLWKYDGADWTMYDWGTDQIIGGIKSVAVDSRGIVWTGIGLNKGTWRFDGSSWHPYYRVDGVSGDNVNALAIDQNDIVWVATRNGISSFDDTAWTTYTDKDGLAGNNVLSIAVDNNNVIWIGTDAGVSSYDGKTWESYSDSDGLVDNYVSSIAVDYNNRKWFGTPRGVSTFYEAPVSSSGGRLKTVSLLGNYPNPFNVETSIEFDLYSWGDVVVAIYNIAGQKIREYSFDRLPAGRKQVIWDGLGPNGERVSSGVYFYRVSLGKNVTGGRMMLVK